MMMNISRTEGPFNLFKLMLQIIPTQMKRMPEDGSLADISLSEDVIVDPVERGFIRDWVAMEDLLHHVLYTGLGWEIGNEGQILFTDPLSTPKVTNFFVHFIVSGCQLYVETSESHCIICALGGQNQEMGRGILQFRLVRVANENCGGRIHMGCSN